MIFDPIANIRLHTKFDFVINKNFQRTCKLRYHLANKNYFPLFT